MTDFSVNIFFSLIILYLRSTFSVLSHGFLYYTRTDLMPFETQNKIKLF